MKLWQIIGIGILGFLLLSGNLYTWFAKGGGAVQEVTEAKDSKIVKGITRSTINVPNMGILNKKEVEAKVPQIPQAIKDDPAVNYTAIKDVPPYEGTTRAIATLKDGTTDMLLQRQPLPFIQFEAKLRGGVGYQIVSSPGAGKVDIPVEFRFLRIEQGHLELRSGVDSAGKYRAGVYGLYEHDLLK